MPVYEYQCTKCHEVHAEVRQINRRDEPAKCPKCGGEARFRVSRPGRFQRGPGWHSRMDGAKMPGRIE